MATFLTSISKRAALSDILIAAASDLNPDAAKKQAHRYEIDARGVKDLLASGDVDIVLNNLTIPEAHAEVSLRALEAGEHVYSREAARHDDR